MLSTILFFVSGFGVFLAKNLSGFGEIVFIPYNQKMSSQTVVITGLGIVNSIANNVSEFTSALKVGQCGVKATNDLTMPYMASVDPAIWQKLITEKKANKILRNNSLTAQISTCAAWEAFADAGLQTLEPSELNQMGLVIAGNNLAQSYIEQNHQKFSKQPEFINPTYAMSYFDTNVLGVISEVLNIHGPGFTVGGASASSNAALFQAFHLVKNGVVPRCMVVGALSELSPLEAQAFAILGAMNTTPNLEPYLASRPFDTNRAGFVYGQGAACVVIENLAVAQKRQAKIYAELAGVALCLDGNHMPEPTVAGEERAMREALQMAQITPEKINYINPHATASRLGDEVELQALKNIFGSHLKSVPVNATKALIGHGLSSAGLMELVATLVQMQNDFVHPHLGLDTPMSIDFDFVGKDFRSHRIDWALSNSFGFGGINTAVVIKNWGN